MFGSLYKKNLFGGIDRPWPMSIHTPNLTIIVHGKTVYILF